MKTSETTNTQTSSAPLAEGSATAPSAAGLALIRAIKRRVKTAKR